MAFLIGADPTPRDQAAGMAVRTPWHNLHDQQVGAVEVSFYLGEDLQADGTRIERRSDDRRFS